MSPTAVDKLYAERGGEVSGFLSVPSVRGAEPFVGGFRRAVNEKPPAAWSLVVTNAGVRQQRERADAGSVGIARLVTSRLSQCGSASLALPT